jgi:hypothetical protein
MMEQLSAESRAIRSYASMSRYSTKFLFIRTYIEAKGPSIKKIMETDLALQTLENSNRWKIL